MILRNRSEIDVPNSQKRPLPTLRYRTARLRARHTGGLGTWTLTLSFSNERLLYSTALVYLQESDTCTCTCACASRNLSLYPPPNRPDRCLTTTVFFQGKTQCSFVPTAFRACYVALAQRLMSGRYGDPRQPRDYASPRTQSPGAPPHRRQKTITPCRLTGRVIASRLSLQYLGLPVYYPSFGSRQSTSRSEIKVRPIHVTVVTPPNALLHPSVARAPVRSPSSMGCLGRTASQRIWSVRPSPSFCRNPGTRPHALSDVWRLHPQLSRRRSLGPCDVSARVSSLALRWSRCTVARRVDGCQCAWRMGPRRGRSQRGRPLLRPRRGLHRGVPLRRGRRRSPGRPAMVPHAPRAAHIRGAGLHDRGHVCHP